MKTFLIPINLFFTIVFIIGLNNCKSPKQNEQKRNENLNETPHEGIIDINHLTIEPVGPYVFRIQFNRDPQQQFRLWFPEVAIFNSDTSRAEIKDAESKLVRATEQKKDTSPFLGMLKKEFDDYRQKNVKE